MTGAWDDPAVRAAVREATAATNRVRVNHGQDPLPPAGVPDDDECEHGLSAWLCEGPNHYPSDRTF